AQLGYTGARGGPPVAIRARELQRLGRRGGTTFKIPDLVEGMGELHKHRRALRPRSQRQRALQQPHRRRVVTKKGAPPSSAKPARRVRRKNCSGSRSLAELAPEQDGAFEVVAKQLIGDRRRRGARVQPVRK